jgi:hypothetical protein
LSPGIQHSVPAAGLVKFLACAAAQLSKHRKECMCVDPAAQQHTPTGSQWHMLAAADATGIALKLTENETRNVGINISRGHPTFTKPRHFCASRRFQCARAGVPAIRDACCLSTDGLCFLQSFCLHQHKRNSSGARCPAWGKEET